MAAMCCCREGAKVMEARTFTLRDYVTAKEASSNISCARHLSFI